jgi:hypothetical protein
MNSSSESHDLLGSALVVIAMLAVTEGRTDHSPIVVAGVTVLLLGCFEHLKNRLKPGR